MSLASIGYERTGQPDFIRRLSDAGVELLIDVRELPLSRRAGFSKTGLAASLAEAGIDYRHMKALGTPKAGRQAAQARRWKDFWPIVEGALARPEARLALAETAELARAKRVCLMCVEADWRECHRSRICETLEAEFGIRAEHLAAP